MKRVASVMLVCVSAMAAPACLGEAIRDQARQTASVDHRCPVERVEMESDATVGYGYAYWLNVCGQRRFYRYQQTQTGMMGGGGAGRFLDETRQMGPAAP